MAVDQAVISCISDDLKDGLTFSVRPSRGVSIVHHIGPHISRFDITPAEAMAFMGAMIRAYYGPGVCPTLSSQKEAEAVASVLAREAWQIIQRKMQAHEHDRSLYFPSIYGSFFQILSKRWGGDA